MKSYLNMNSTVTTLGANYLARTGNFYVISRFKVCTVANYRYYSTSKSDSQSSHLPILTLNNLNNEDCIKSSRELLKGKGGIYSFINIVNGNQYIGSAGAKPIDFYLRLNEHHPLYPLRVRVGK